jgi:hypothetical protein
MKNPKTGEEQRSYDSKYWLLQFELKKDMARLATTKSKDERLAVLKRLVYYPFPWQLAFKTLAHTYLKPGKELESLERKWEERKQGTRLQNQ